MSRQLNIGGDHLSQHQIKSQQLDVTSCLNASLNERESSVIIHQECFISHHLKRSWLAK
jgi:hypothetical protein